GPGRPSPSPWRSLEKAGRRNIAAPVAASRVLATGGRERQNMDVLRASQGRESVDGLRGMSRIHASARRAAPGRTAQRADRAGEQLPARNDPQPEARITVDILSQSGEHPQKSPAGRGGRRGSGNGTRGEVLRSRSSPGEWEEISDRPCICRELYDHFEH